MNDEDSLSTLGHKVYNPFDDKIIKKVYGPYKRNSDGRQMVVIHFEGDTKTGMSWARWQMIQKLRRPLDRWTEHVDHKNDNPQDDRIENLQILTPLENNRKALVGKPSPLKGVEKGWEHGSLYGWQKKKCRCEICLRAMEDYRVARNAKRRKASKPRGTYSHDPDHGTNARYRRGCRCAECQSAHASAQKEWRKKD